MKNYRAKVIVTNEKYYQDLDTLKNYDKHQFNRIVNHYFNEADKDMMWKLIKKSYPGLDKSIEVFKRSYYAEERHDGITYTEEKVFPKTK